VLKINEVVAKVFRARPFDIELVAVIVEGEGNQGGSGVSTVETVVDREANTKVSQPPPPYDMST
jgi:hypothetical protein